MNMWVLRVACLAAGAALAGCQGTSLRSIEVPTKKIEYKSAGKQQIERLEVPPDLTRPAGDDRFFVPGAGSTTYSEYQKDRGGRVQPSGPAAVLPVQDGARIER